jgi:hypothetical protein
MNGLPTKHLIALLINGVEAAVTSDFFSLQLDSAAPTISYFFSSFPLLNILNILPMKFLGAFAHAVLPAYNIFRIPLH